MRFHFLVKGMNCAACVGHVERAAKKVLSGEDEVTVSLLTNSVCVITKEDIEEDVIKERLSSSLKAAGYTLVCKGEEKRDNVFGRDLIKWIVSALFTLFVTYLSMGKMIGLPIPSFLDGEKNALLMAVVQLIFCIPVILLNFKFFKNGFRSLFHLSPNMDSLIALGSGASLLYGIALIFMIVFFKNEDLKHSLLHDLYFESAVMILTLVSLGKLLEGRAKEKASDAVRELAEISPKYAHVLRDGKEAYVAVEEIKKGDLVLIRAGEMIPVDGIVTDGNGCTDESAMTGESMPVDKERDSLVCAASVLLDGFLTVRATKVGEETSLSRMIRLLEDAAASKAPIARIADKVSGVFVPIVMGISVLTLTVWMIFTGNIEMALRSSVSVLVISCPCALGLATPTAITVGIGRGAKMGILFRSAEALEELSHCKTVVFDKTGTLTTGKPILTDVYVYEGDLFTVMSAVSSVERGSSHPIASAIVSGAELLGITEMKEVEDFRSVTGVGAIGRIEEAIWHVGKPQGELDGRCEGDVKKEEKNENGIQVVLQQGGYDVRKDFEFLEENGKTAVVIMKDSMIVGILGIADSVRNDARTAVEALKIAGVSTLMLTGDNERTAACVAQKAAIDGYFASLMPDDKERIIREISKEGDCAMVGDGINDAPALLCSRVGIAVGAGTEIAIDCADVVISDSSPMGVCDAYFLSRACIRVIKQNLFWALFYNAVCIPIAAGVLYPLLSIQLSPMIASLAMSCSSVCVVLNALRLRRIRLRTAEKRETREYTLSIEGMMCMRCVEHVKRALEEAEGVESATVDLSSNTAVIKGSSSVKSLIGAVTRAGYKAREMKK